MRNLSGELSEMFERSVPDVEFSLNKGTARSSEGIAVVFWWRVPS